MQEGRIARANIGDGLAAGDGVATADTDILDIGIDRQHIVGVAQHEDRDLIGIAGNGRDLARSGGADIGACGRSDINAFI